MVLNDLEIVVISTKAMRLTEKESLLHLKTKGYDISARTFYYTLGHIASETRKRAFEIAKNFLEDHMETIDELQNIKKMMYEEANKENDSLKKTMILGNITETMIPYISAYREATKDIIEGVVKEVEKENINLSVIRN